MVLWVSGSNHFRQRTGEEQRATWLELFFDLVFVFAVTQLSHLLLNHLTLTGVAQTLFLLLVVWWAWIYTAWMTNWFDPESVHVRLVLLVVMAASLMMAVAIPKAFGELALLFACSYVTLQVARNAFNVYATPRDNELHPVFLRILVWSLAAGALWLAGGLAPSGARTWLWIAALAVDYVGPTVGYWTPRLGRSMTSRVGDRNRALCRAVPALHHHCAGRVDRRHRCDRVLARTRPSDRDVADGGVRVIRRPLVALLRRGGLARTAVPVSVRRAGAGWRATPTPTCTFRSSPASSSWPWETRL